ncbi:hypothetical protein BJF93_00975 [Xaviernesmea oryzae]|uniref:Uncharacterized protein n=1 Tax=Xaviernesmea oryzae TaxID=464029 RepID=A0A1Q9B3V2_9HYPH|nr:hypothetical protein BJF93_00975 [Xaviernesmea oryzae]
MPFEDDLRRRRFGSPSGRNGRIGRRGAIKEKTPNGFQAPATLSSPIARLAIASGSQPAVVKLVSFATGSARVGKLLAYQSRGGELPIETDSGEVIEGKDWIKEVANAWAEVDGRKPSRDVLRLTITGPVAVDAVGEALKEALPGHRIAWSLADDEHIPRIELVISAARRRQPGEGRAGRIFDNRKSLRELDDRLKRTLGTGVVIQLHAFDHGVEGVARSLRQLNRTSQSIVTVIGLDKAGAFGADRRLPSENDAVLEEAKAWKRDLRSQERRDVAHIVLSAKPGTPKDAFVGAARAMLAREFADHRYLFALHEDRKHLHIHAVVKMRAESGQRLHPKIEDLRRWRVVLAAEARERNIPMDAVSRFERANPPGFKMKDIRRLERGEASESVTRRVEAVRDQAVHIPSRPEGVRHAMAAAAAWTGVGASTETLSLEPAVQPNSVRLYQAEGSDTRSSTPLFTLDRAAAAQVVAGDGSSLRMLDVSEAVFARLARSQAEPNSQIVVSPEMARRSQPTTAVDPRLVGRLQLRTVEAVLRSSLETAVPTIPEASERKELVMANLEVMTSAFAEMESNLDTIAQNLPPERQQEFGTLRAKLKTTQSRMLEAQTEIDKKRGRLEGETYVTPAPKDFSAFVAERRGEAIRYSHRGPDGRIDAVAFSDHGNRVEVTNWRDRETVLAALQLGAEKWGAVRVNGTDRYKALAVDLAAEHGFQLTNPELQERLAVARDRIARERLERASVVAGPTPAQTQFALQQREISTPLSEPVVPTSETEAKPAQAVMPTGFIPAEAGDTIKPAGEDRASMLAAMQEAAKRWETISVTGNDRQKALAVSIAAEHGFRLSNPELQEKLAEARQKVADRRTPVAFADGTTSEKLPIDTGETVKPVDRDPASMLTAMRAAAEKWGSIAVNGTDRDKALAVELAAQHGFHLTNPELQEKLATARGKIEALGQREAVREDTPPGFVNGVAVASDLRRTEPEIAIALETVKAKTIAEAQREVRQAEQTAKSGETPVDGGGEDHAYRRREEAAAAVRAEKSIEQNPSKPVPTEVNQSPEIEHQRADQAALLQERETNAQKTIRQQKP